MSYVWFAPEQLRILVRARVAGEVKDPKLPRALHVGFLGDDPNSPEAKAGLARGVLALF